MSFFKRKFQSLNPSTQKAVKISAGLHLTVFFALIFSGITPKCSSKKDPFIFQMVQVPSNNFNANPTPQRPAPKKVTPRPKKTPPKKVKPKPKPKTKPKVKPKTKAKPKKTQAPKKMSFADFKKQHKIKKAAPKAPPKKKYIPPPQQEIDTSALNDITKSLDRLKNQARKDYQSERNSSSKALQQRALQKYLGKLKARINSLWQSPNLLLSTTVRFTILRNGQITNIKVVKGSGNSVFDRSILQAFYDLKQFSPPPGGQQSYELTFSKTPH